MTFSSLMRIGAVVSCATGRVQRATLPQGPGERKSSAIRQRYQSPAAGDAGSGVRAGQHCPNGNHGMGVSPRPPIYTPAVGGVQRLKNGNTLVGFGFAGHASEVRPDRSLAWEADVIVDGQPAIVYRLIRITSLYHYQEP